jgi:hypothetical protein
MSNINRVENENFLDSLRLSINESMFAAVEPEIQKALVEIERTMRKRVAEICISMVKGEIDIFRNQNMLCITIKDSSAQGDKT